MFLEYARKRYTATRTLQAGRCLALWAWRWYIESAVWGTGNTCRWYCFLPNGIKYQDNAHLLIEIILWYKIICIVMTLALWNHQLHSDRRLLHRLSSNYKHTSVNSGICKNIRRATIASKFPFNCRHSRRLLQWRQIRHPVSKARPRCPATTIPMCCQGTTFAFILWLIIVCITQIIVCKCRLFLSVLCYQLFRCTWCPV